MRAGLPALGAMLLLAAAPADAACNIIDGKAYGDCAGVTVKTGSEPFREVAGYASISGISEGARVLLGGSLSASGISDRIIVEKGGRADVGGQVGSLQVAGSATITGMVDSVILVEGGEITLEGMAGRISGQGEAHLAAGSVVGGFPLETGETRIYGADP